MSQVRVSLPFIFSACCLCTELICTQRSRFHGVFLPTPLNSVMKAFAGSAVCCVWLLRSVVCFFRTVRGSLAVRERPVSKASGGEGQRLGAVQGR